MITEDAHYILAIGCLISVTAGLAFSIYITKYKQLKWWHGSAICLAFISVFISYCYQFVNPDNAPEIVEFSYACKNLTNQDIFNTIDNVDTISIRSIYSKEADTWDSQYFPYSLYERLLLFPKPYQNIYHIGYSIMPDRKEIISLMNSDIAKESRGKLVSEVKVPRYEVKVVYSATENIMIQKIYLTINDNAKGAMLASQTNFQLKLGKVKNRNLRRWMGWGGSQYAESCPNISPVELIYAVLKA